MVGTTRLKQADGREFGQMLVAKGLLGDDELGECLAAQQKAVASGGSIPTLPDLLVSNGFLSRAQVEDAVAALRGKVRYCARCEVNVYVPLSGPAGEKCPACREGLEWREERHDVRVDDDAKLLAAAALPLEVAEAAKDTQRRFGKYVLIEQIGRGGAAVVHKAWDTYLGQPVALKFIRPRSNVPVDTQVAKQEHDARILDLLKEARNSIKLRHANIVSVFDAGKIGREFYIAMEYLEGNTLAEHIAAAHKRGVPSPLYEDPRTVIGQLRDVARAVHFAHSSEKPIMHCDIKPGNILMDLAGKPYVLDFGLAQELRDVGAVVEGRGLVRGTPAYMAPEQALAHHDEVDPRTDIYAIGAILYELLAGQPPFWGDVLEILRAVVADPPVPPLQKSGGLPLPGAGRLEEVALRCIEKDKNRRYKTADEVAEELDKILKLMETGASRGRAVRDAKRMAIPQLQEQQRRLDAEMGVFNIEGARRGYREIAASTEDAAVREWVSSCLVEVGSIEALKRQIIDRLNEKRPTLPKLELLERVIENAEILKATEKKLIVFVGEKAIEVQWTAIRPSQVVSLARDACGLSAPQDRLAIGIYCMKAGMLADAKQEFAGLLGTVLDESAKQYLASLG